jgi:Domain of unknown function (DUF3883)
MELHDPEQRPAAIRRLVGKFDPAARDARNRDLGRAGEEFVVAFERRRLEKAGKSNLARDVRWVSDLDGDGYGYDVQSFELDGEPRLLEIKDHLRQRADPILDDQARVRRRSGAGRHLPGPAGRHQSR